MSDDKKFDPKKRSKLNNPLRLEWVPPERVAQLIDLKKGGQYVDLGAGTGYLSRSIGELVDAPIVHAVDIEPIMITEMETTLSDAPWIKPTLMERNSLPFDDNSIDGLWCITVFHEVGAPEAILKEILRILKPGGTLLVVDWMKSPEACEQGPPLNHRIAENDVITHLEGAGFTNVSIESGFTHHFGITASKT